MNKQFSSILLKHSAFSIFACLLIMPILAKQPSSYLLGPTGIIGKVSKNSITVEKIEPKSPSANLLKKGDVIIGVAGKKFSTNPRKDIAAQINAAETDGGKLPLLLKSNKTVDITLTRLGAYSKTSPYNCEKTELLVKRIANKVATSEEYKKGQILSGWLGLMATGEKEYLDLIKSELPQQEWANPDADSLSQIVQGTKASGYVGWYWGYALITLCEYHLLTGDKSVLPAIELYATSLAKGQDAAGIWGHRMATPARGGRLPGYAHINQPSLSCLIGLVLAQKCGVKSKLVTDATEHCLAFYRTFVGKGAIPYGVHLPNSRIFNNNGSSAMAAIAFAIHGDEKSAKFFSQQAAASHQEVESGHATHFFNVMWTPLGAAVAGPEATQAFSESSRWLYTSYRGWDDRFTYNGVEQKSASSSGALLLSLCLPRRNLYITGKNADERLWVTASEAKKLNNLSDIDYKKLSESQLLEMFDHHAPQVRRRAVWSLRERDPKKFIPQLESFMKGGNLLQKTGALEYFGWQCPEEQANTQIINIVNILNNPNEAIEVRASAASTLSHRGKLAYPYYEAIIDLVLLNKKEDVFDLIDGELAKSLTTLCSDPIKEDIIKNPTKFYRAIQKLASNKRAVTRGAAVRLIQSIPLDDFHYVAKEVKDVALNNDPTLHSYHNPQSAEAVAAATLASLGIEDGLKWAEEIIDAPWGKGGFKVRAIHTVLKAYGPHAKPLVDRIKSDPETLKLYSGGRWAKSWQEAIKATEKTPTKKLIPFEKVATTP